MEKKQFSTYQLISDFNHSALRKNLIPMGMVSGWPCVRKIGKTLCITIPYYARSIKTKKVALSPIYCSVTIPVGNPDRIMDFTIYPHQRSWSDVDYTKPAGYFKHAALDDVNTKQEYQELCKQLYGYYDRMIAAIQEKKPFAEQEDMIALFSKLMEPGHYPLYLHINKKFYSYFCRL